MKFVPIPLMERRRRWTTAAAIAAGRLGSYLAVTAFP